MAATMERKESLKESSSSSTQVGTPSFTFSFSFSSLFLITVIIIDHSFQLVEAKSLSAKQLTLIEGSSATEAASSSSALQVSFLLS